MGHLEAFGFAQDIVCIYIFNVLGTSWGPTDRALFMQITAPKAQTAPSATT